jgi:cbb3-type cytochrome oxidase subunit 3
MNKVVRAFEIFWLIMCFVGIFMCVYSAFKKDNQGIIYFLIFSVVSGILYALRKYQRKKLEDSQK